MVRQREEGVAHAVLSCAVNAWRSPPARVAELTPGLRKQHFAPNLLRSLFHKLDA